MQTVQTWEPVASSSTAAAFTFISGSPPPNSKTANGWGVDGLSRNRFASMLLVLSYFVSNMRACWQDCHWPIQPATLRWTASPWCCYLHTVPSCLQKMFATTAQDSEVHLSNVTWLCVKMWYTSSNSHLMMKYRQMMIIPSVFGALFFHVISFLLRAGPLVVLSPSAFLEMINGHRSGVDVLWSASKQKITTCIYVYMSIYNYIIYICIYVYMHICICIYVWQCVYMCMYTYVYVCVDVYIYIYIYTYIYTYCIYIYILYIYMQYHVAQWSSVLRFFLVTLGILRLCFPWLVPWHFIFWFLCLVRSLCVLGVFSLLGLWLLRGLALAIFFAFRLGRLWEFWWNIGTENKYSKLKQKNVKHLSFSTTEWCLFEFRRLVFGVFYILFLWTRCSILGILLQAWCFSLKYNSNRILSPCPLKLSPTHLRKQHHM